MAKLAVGIPTAETRNKLTCLITLCPLPRLNFRHRISSERGSSAARHWQLQAVVRRLPLERKLSLSISTPGCMPALVNADIDFFPCTILLQLHKHDNECASMSPVLIAQRFQTQHGYPPLSLCPIPSATHKCTRILPQIQFEEKSALRPPTGTRSP